MAVGLLLKRGLLAGLPAGAVGEPLFPTDVPRLYVGSSAGNRLLGVLDNIAATGAPTVNDDAGDGYSVRSLWVDTTADLAYICKDATTGAAVWQLLGSATSAGMSQLTGDVTAGPGSGSQAATIAAGVVTNAKLADMATARFKGRTTAGTGSPEDLTGAQATALLSAFVGAGGTAAKGLVPAPGATAHPNSPFVLGDDGNFKAIKGEILGGSSVPAEQTTSSTSFTDLATAQHVGITLDVASDVYVIQSCSYVPTSGNPIGVIVVDIANVDTTIGYAQAAGVGMPTIIMGIVKFALAAGAHTLKMQFRVTSGTGQFGQRTMLIVRG